MHGLVVYAYNSLQSLCLPVLICDLFSLCFPTFLVRQHINLHSHCYDHHGLPQIHQVHVIGPYDYLLDSRV